MFANLIAATFGSAIFPLTGVIVKKLSSVLIKGFALCNLRVLCVSVVDIPPEITHHRDTENTEVAQRTEIRALPETHNNTEE
jgi:hypothetical protein